MIDDFNSLLKNYKALQLENKQLKEEIKLLRKQLGIEVDQPVGTIEPQKEIDLLNTSTEILQFETVNPSVTNNSSSAEKIKRFLSLFKGRDDVFARRWENRKKETAGYSPACSNEWKSGICQKPKVSCTECKHKEYIPLDEKTIEAHLRGQNNMVVGVYPLLLNETCHFLAIDFDDEGWQKDVSTLQGVCSLFDIPIAVERSRSGNGVNIQ